MATPTGRGTLRSASRSIPGRIAAARISPRKKRASTIFTFQRASAPTITARATSVVTNARRAVSAIGLLSPRDDRRKRRTGGLPGEAEARDGHARRGGLLRRAPARRCARAVAHPGRGAGADRRRVARRAVAAAGPRGAADGGRGGGLPPRGLALGANPSRRDHGQGLPRRRHIAQARGDGALA